ncbi:hypothetical protein HN592_01295, partial [Candidatus Woesearchaeota archaeon]|nr:hypothetical protein [Candidatus Woesearchaeota archaeon]MBT7134131.1 hypothetical protein [Candidatus Woesearchaeota archaeon]MBT7627131.1 hypothetical protein [Candidatus Woesearchaeota archaeon]
KGVWINAVCKKCGNNEQKKYYVKTLSCFNKFFDVSCSCGNSETEHFGIQDIAFSEGKRL